MSTLSPFREEVALEAPAPPPAATAGGPAPSGKWVVLVAGFDYPRTGVDFQRIALNRMELLVRRHAAAQRRAKARLAQVIATVPRFVLFDLKSGRVRTRTATPPKGTWTWKEIARFQPVGSSNYRPAGGRRHVFNNDQAGRMSITDVYKHVRKLGRTDPGSVAELSFLAHGWIGGPILVNSDESVAFQTRPDRDPNDKDARMGKDFRAPTMNAAALADFRAAFAADGFVWIWGCAFANSPRQVLHRVLSSAKYRQTRLGGLVDTDSFRLAFSRTEAETFFSVDTTFFPPRGANGAFPLSFDRMLAQIKAFLRGRLSQTYCQAVARAAGVRCFGALPGTYADYERGTALPVMVVPTKAPPYADDFTRSIRFYTTYLGVTLDPERRSYGRFDP
ncbi:MAG TPA: hypothetical protein VE596_19585 [Gaiellaceae bacterium]|jgi:hypothetical protein|nr:hypothetical protein [Gaiellaceae bacterium]